MTSKPRKPLAEVHGNRTHLPPSADGTPDLKSGGPTSEPRTSAATLSSDVSGSAAGWRAFRRYPLTIINPVTEKDNLVPGPAAGAPARARSQATLMENPEERLLGVVAGSGLVRQLLQELQPEALGHRQAAPPGGSSRLSLVAEALPGPARSAVRASFLHFFGKAADGGQLL